jgi:Zn/Cd-binding protein ZinT
MGHWDYACNKMIDETTDQDRKRGFPQLAAAARILAAEVERLRGGKPQTADYVSGCCHTKTETAGHKNPGIKVWFWCTSCRKPCDIFFADHKAQSEKTQS